MRTQVVENLVFEDVQVANTVRAILKGQNERNTRVLFPRQTTRHADTKMQSLKVMILNGTQ